MGRLDGKVAFISGGARGQGRSHAVRLAEEGADIVVFDALTSYDTLHYQFPTKEDLDETVALVERLDRRILARKVDVREPDSVDRLVADALDEFGHIDIVCANAGIGGLGRSWELTEQEWRDIIDVDLTGVWHTAKAVIPAMIEAQRGGAMVFTSSAAGVRGQQNLGHYVAAKHGVLGLMKTMANELAPYRIRVNAVLPGTVDTQVAMNEHMLQLYRPDLEKPTREDAREVMMTWHALPVPWLEPVDISNAILWLVSDEARYVTGVALPVDAGWINKAD